MCIDLYPASYDSIVCLRKLNESAYPDLRSAIGMENNYGFVEAHVKVPFWERISEILASILTSEPHEKGKYGREFEHIFETGIISVFGSAFVLAPFMCACYLNEPVIRNGVVMPSSIISWVDKDKDGKIDYVHIHAAKFPPMFRPPTDAERRENDKLFKSQSIRD